MDEMFRRSITRFRQSPRMNIFTDDAGYSLSLDVRDLKDRYDRGRDGGLNSTPPSEPDGRISRIRLSSQWFLGETSHKHKSHVPD
jgi:hypothetical protein